MFSFRFQFRKIKEKFQKKTKLNDEEVSLEHEKDITIKNKHTFLSKLIYLLNKFSYHLGSAILLIVFCRYLSFSIDKISNFVLKKTTFILKNELFSLFYPITSSFLYSPLSRSSSIIFSWLILSLSFLLVNLFLKKNFFVERRLTKIIAKEKLVNALSSAFLVIAFIFFMVALYEVVF